MDWKGDAEKVSGFQVIVNNLVWDSGYTQVVSGHTREDMPLKVCLALVIFCPESATITGFYWK